MADRIAEIVHIIPLGHEIDRAIRPFDTALANRVYLIVDTGEGSSNGMSQRDKDMNREQEDCYTPNVIEALKRKNIEVRVVRTRTFDLETLLRAITSVIRLELMKDNEVWVNMSSSGRLGAVAAFLAGMAYQVKTYYVHSDHFSRDDERPVHGLSFCTENKVTLLPEFFFSRPNEQETLVLSRFYEEKLKGDTMPELTPKEMMNYLVEKDAEGFRWTMNNSATNSAEKEDTKEIFRKSESRMLMRLANLLRRMECRGYIEQTNIGRKKMYRITTLGEHALSLCGMDAEVYAKQFDRVKECV